MNRTHCDVCDKILRKGDKTRESYWSFRVEMDFENVETQMLHDSSESFEVCGECYRVAKEGTIELLSKHVKAGLMLTIRGLIELDFLVCKPENDSNRKNGWQVRTKAETEKEESEETEK